MKTEKTRYYSPTLDASLKSSFDEIKGKAKINAESMASKNLPRVSADVIRPYFEESHLEFQLLNDRVGTELRFQTTCEEVSEKKKSSEQQTRDLRTKLASSQEKQVYVNTKCKNTPYPAYLIRFILAEFAIICISLFEGIQTVPVYETWGFNLAEAILAGILFSVVIAIFAHTFLKIVNLGKTIWHRRLIALALLVLLTTLFTYMANVRAEYLSSVVNSNAADTLNIHFSPFPFVLTSLLLFIVAVAVCHFYMPTDQQKEAIREYTRLNNEKKAIEDEIAQLEAKIDAVQQENSDLRNMNASIVDYGSMLENMIMNHAEMCLALWKKHNLMSRPDSCKPDCFDDPSYPFTFKTNFPHLNLIIES